MARIIYTWSGEQLYVRADEIDFAPVTINGLTQHTLINVEEGMPKKERIQYRKNKRNEKRRFFTRENEPV